MASGFDTRQSGRNSFASQGPAVKQIGRGVQSDTHRGAQVVGGGTVASGVPNAQLTDPGNITGQLGEFMSKAMEPYVERRKQERFFEGFTRAQAGESIDDLAKSHKGVVGKLFGPTSLEDGAQFYAAMEKVDQWAIDTTNRMDELIQLDPKGQAKLLAETSQSMLGDNPYVNAMVQKQLIEKTGPMLDVINKKRYIWQQATARKSQFDALNTGATSLQQMARQFNDVTDPTDDETAAMDVSRANFLGLMQKPAGMSDDTYRETLTASLESFAQNGNWYAYNALMDAGVLTVLDDDGKDKVIKAHDKYESTSLDDAKGNHIAERLEIEEKVERGQMSDLEAIAAYDAINVKISRETGLRKRAFDANFLFGEGKRVIGQIAADERKQEERDYQAKVRKTERALDLHDKQVEEQQKYSAALDAVRMGKPRSFTASGGDASAKRQVYFNLYGAKDWTTLGRAFDKEHEFDPDVAKIAQAKMVSAGGISLTGEAAQGYEEWQGMMKASPGMAAYVYGDQHKRMLLMQRLINGKVAPELAYQRAFANLNAAKHPGTMLRPGDRKATMEAIGPMVEDLSSNWFTSTFTGVRPNEPIANHVITNVITETVAGLQANSDLPPEALVKQATQAAIASGAVEVYGGNMAWRGDSRSKKASQVVGVTDREFGDLLYGEIDDKFKATGRKDGAELEYEIHRTPIQGGGFVLSIHPTDPDNGIPIIITSNELKTRATKAARGELNDSAGQRSRPRVGKVSWGS